jgi:18S rRNA (adenine1779-N6/adenine1780-N6)-dimethyltransferase
MDLDAADEWEGIMDIDEDEDELPQFFKEERDRKRDEKMANPTKRKKKGKVSELVRSKVRKVLDACELISSKNPQILNPCLTNIVLKAQLLEKRARMCDQNDFLSMLEGFNGEGIHFA